jgi:cobalt-zinc-cadmium efflux system membrane fusion protein
MKLRRRHGILGALVALVLGGWYSLHAVTAEPGEWTSVERDDLVLDVDVTGTLKAIDTDLIEPPQLRDTWQFKIAQIAPEGETVKKDDVVLAFDASEQQQRLQREIAERDAARKRVEKAERELRMSRHQDELRLAEAQARERKAALKADHPEHLVAAREIEQVRLDLELARKEVAYLTTRLDSSKRSADATLEALRNQLEQAEKQVEQTQADIQQMQRKAERNGTVVYVANWRDEKKNVGDSCWRGEAVIEVPDLNRMKALGQVHEADAGRIAEGQRVTFRLDAHPDVEFAGRVSSIWRTVQTESWSSPQKVVRLEIELDETDTRRMRPGMRIRGSIEVERVEDALLVDADAVFLESAGPMVYRRTWLGHEAVPVALGRRNDTRVEVLEGLSEDDEVSRIDLGRRRGAA